MNMQNPLQKLAEASAALEGSGARGLLTRLFDEGTFVELDRLARDGDKPAEAAAGYGMVEGSPVYAFAQDHAICSGAIGRAQAAKIAHIYALAAQNGAPIVGIFDSDGAKLGEGIDAMDAIADILLASNNLSGVVPQIAVITGACVGSSALIAANADLVIGVKGAAYRLNVGDKDAAPAVSVSSAEEAVEKARELLELLPANNLAGAALHEWQSAAMPACQDAFSALDAVADEDSAVKLYEGSDCTALALARVGGTPCGLVALSGEICCSGASNAARFVRLCDAFSLPVITFVDAAGFQTLKGAAKLSHAYAEATTAKCTVVTGKAYGPVYIAVAGKSAGADVVLAWPDAVISSLAPETAVHILWKDRLAAMTDPIVQRAALAEEYAATAASPLEAAAGGFVTDVVVPAETKAKIVALLDMLSGKRVSRLPKKHSNILL